MRGRCARRAAAASLGLVLVASVTALAATRAHEGAGMAVHVPDGWSVRSDENRMTIAAPDGAAAITFMVLPGGAPREILAGLIRDVGRFVAGLTVLGGAREERANGLPRAAQRARGRLAGQAIELWLVAQKTPSSKTLAVVALIAADRLAAHQAQVEQVLASPSPRP